MYLKLMRRAFNLAVEWEMLESSPLTRLQLFNPDNRMENYLSPEQLDKLVTVLRTAPPRTVCNVALFLLATGARLNEALRATWDQIDKDKRVWNIPASNSKSKRIRSVPLNDAALEVLGPARHRRQVRQPLHQYQDEEAAGECAQGLGSSACPGRHGVVAHS